MAEHYQYHKFQIGDIVKVRVDYFGDDVLGGELLTFVEEDGSPCPKFEKSDGERLYFYNHDLELANSEPAYSIF